MNHVIISREYPPGPYPLGGIGTYVDHISRLLASHGETVHVIGQLSPNATTARESRLAGRLIVHRVPLDEPLPQGDPADRETLRAFGDSVLPAQAFMWQAAILAESLIESDAIDVIEAQEYEAPSYFLLLRRALGLATARPVPVIVHLHTPTEFVFKQNEWDQARPDYLPLKRLEDYTIRAADALLCPSRFLARIAERHYHIETGSIQVMPYPVGAADVLHRDTDIWTHGTICYVGRLEPRKGVTEWIDAAVAVAADDPALQFTFIGGDTSYSGTGDRSMREVLLTRIPNALRARFTFIDNIPREQLLGHLARARIAVVPSRWENFPNTCIEAMSSGLPVLASPTGGMAEMVDDGRTGWIAGGPDARSLEIAFRRALATPSTVLEEMGAAAAASIRVLCNNDDTIRRHLEFRRRVAERGSIRSTRVVSPSARMAQDASRSGERPSRNSSPTGISVVVRSRRPDLSSGCIESLVSQTIPPAHVVLIVPPDSKVREPFHAGSNRSAWHVVRHVDAGSAAASNEALRIAGCNSLGVTFLDDEWILAPEYVAVMDGVLRQCPDVGIVTPWHKDDGDICTTLPPAFPYQWVWNDIGPCAAFRMAAIDEAGGMRTTLTDSYAVWDLCNAILAGAWRAAPFPRALASRAGTALPVAAPIGRPAVSHESILSRFPELLAPDAAEVAVLLRLGVGPARTGPGLKKHPPTGTMTLRDVLHATPEQRRDLVARAMADPAHVARWMIWHGRRALVTSRLHHLVAAARAALLPRQS